MVMELRRVLPYINNHREIIVQLGYYSGHIANPFSPLFYPPRSEYPFPFYLMCPRINNQNMLDPLWMDSCHVTISEFKSNLDLGVDLWF